MIKYLLIIHLNLSARSYVTLCINKNLTFDNQKILVQKNE
jgi:hypothetical protein